MQPRSILETALYCNDLDASEAFYRRVFDLEPILKQPGRLVVFRVGNDVLLLFDPAATERPIMVGSATVPLTAPPNTRELGPAGW